MFAGIVLFFISTTFILVGFLFLNRLNRLKATGKKAQAMVIQHNVHYLGSSRSHRPVVRFVTDKEVTVEQELKTSTKPRIKEGTRVEVIYDPLNPTDVEINSFFRMEVMPRLFIGLGVSGVIFAILSALELVHMFR